MVAQKVRTAASAWSVSTFRKERGKQEDPLFDWTLGGLELGDQGIGRKDNQERQNGKEKKGSGCENPRQKKIGPGEKKKLQKRGFRRKRKRSPSRKTGQAKSQLGETAKNGISLIHDVGPNDLPPTVCLPVLGTKPRNK